MRRHQFLFFIVLSATIGLISCQDQTPSYSISELKVFTNFDLNGDSLLLEMDLQNGPYTGIVIPSPYGADGDSIFEFQFKIKNWTAASQQYAYKIYYQNESYKHSESLPSKTYNPKSADNFYGSWVADSLIGFKLTSNIGPNDSLIISDSFTISGNPLNLDRYFGVNPTENKLTPEELQEAENNIKSDSAWYASIIKKAEENNRSIEKQLTLDANWDLQNNRSQKKTSNQRWQNNPRVGKYEFMLVVGLLEEINQLPNFILDPRQSIDKLDARMNPFYYFGAPRELKKLENITVVHSNQKLRTFAVLRPNKGMYYNEVEFTNPVKPKKELGSNDSETFRTAHFMQFLNSEVRDSSLHNINLAADVGGVDYSIDLFNRNRETTLRNNLSFVDRPERPGINAYYDEANERLIIANPGNSQQPYRKENAGVEGRFGFTYGKFRARIQFPETLSDQGVWNGITCAFWLKFHFSQDWNMRDECGNGGYLESGYSNEDAVRIPKATYSEIDIEIVKASRNWPLTSYDMPDTVKKYDPSQDRNLLVTCTNWDLACPEPSNFSVGAQEFKSGTRKYITHRWSDWYKALTLKTENPHNETVGDIYLYEIDWQPNEIIWRIGENKDQMTEVGYMDSSITKIPNNQMSPVMSQEFHYGHWWPTTPYPQGDIPYPANPIQGALYEIVIE